MQLYEGNKVLPDRRRLVPCPHSIQEGAHYATQHSVMKASNTTRATKSKGLPFKWPMLVCNSNRHECHASAPFRTCACNEERSETGASGGGGGKEFFLI